METGLVFMRLTYSSRNLKQAQCWHVLPAEVTELPMIGFPFDAGFVVLVRQ
ncbi:MAG: hypothetical protein BWX84_03250 [Verrucomicrobia bacterium ADurb.Bin118]|jgi:hypothetical protein|nr:MAG: hypothetical protein BWX84_03250 [Verrucomicrobia bacterium ADurb.Bin118]